MAARLRELFTPRAAGSNVLFSCHGITCRVFGTTVPVSALPGEEALTFTAHLPEGRDRGLIAVAVHHQFNGHKVWSGYIIELTRDKNGLVHVDLDHSWVPAGAQIVQIDHLGVHLLTDTMMLGDGFTTHEGTAKKHGLSYVPDGNLLMRCLAGAATVDEVRAVAQAQVEEKSARERLAEIEPKIRHVEALTEEVGVASADLGTEYRRLREIEQRARALRGAIRSDSASAGALNAAGYAGTYAAFNAALGE